MEATGKSLPPRKRLKKNGNWFHEERKDNNVHEDGGFRVRDTNELHNDPLHNKSSLPDTDNKSSIVDADNSSSRVSSLRIGADTENALDVLAHAQARVSSAAEVLARAKSEVLRKTADAVRKAAIAKQALNLASVVAKGEVKKLPKDEIRVTNEVSSDVVVPFKPSVVVSSSSTVDDEELALQLHREMNSSPRISRRLRKSCAEEVKVKEDTKRNAIKVKEDSKKRKFKIFCSNKTLDASSSNFKPHTDKDQGYEQIKGYLYNGKDKEYLVNGKDQDYLHNTRYLDNKKDQDYSHNGNKQNQDYSHNGNRKDQDYLQNGKNKGTLYSEKNQGYLYNTKDEDYLRSEKYLDYLRNEAKAGDRSRVEGKRISGDSGGLTDCSDHESSGIFGVDKVSSKGSRSGEGFYREDFDEFVFEASLGLKELGSSVVGECRQEGASKLERLAETVAVVMEEELFRCEEEGESGLTSREDSLPMEEKKGCGFKDGVMNCNVAVKGLKCERQLGSECLGRVKVSFSASNGRNLGICRNSSVLKSNRSVSTKNNVKVAKKRQRLLSSLPRCNQGFKSTKGCLDGVSLSNFQSASNISLHSTAFAASSSHNHS